MKQLNVLIVDDDQNSLSLSYDSIKTYVEGDSIFCARTATETIQILQSKKIDLAFLDIDMPDTNGFTIAEYIQKNMPHVSYVFLTGYANFAAKSYEFEPIDFLTKPVDVIRLQKTFERYESKKQPKHDYLKERIALDTVKGFVLLSPLEIMYASKEGRVIKIHTKDNQEYSINYTMDQLERMLYDYEFFRIHQSYLIPLNEIYSVNASKFGYTYEVILTDKTVLPVSRSKYQELRALLEKKGIQFI